MKMQQTDSFSNSQDRRADWLLQPLPLLVYLFGASVGAWLGIDSMFVIGGVAGKLLLIVFLFAIPLGANTLRGSGGGKPPALAGKGQSGQSSLRV